MEKVELISNSLKKEVQQFNAGQKSSPPNITFYLLNYLSVGFEGHQRSSVMNLLYDVMNTCFKVPKTGDFLKSCLIDGSQEENLAEKILEEEKRTNGGTVNYTHALLTLFLSSKNDASIGINTEKILEDMELNYKLGKDGREIRPVGNNFLQLLMSNIAFQKESEKNFEPTEKILNQMISEFKIEKIL